MRLQWVTGKYKSNKGKSKLWQNLIGAADRLCAYVSVHQHLFRNKTKSNFDKAQLYIEGKVTSGPNGIERISGTLDADYDAMHHYQF